MNDIIKLALWNMVMYDVDKYKELEHDKGYFSLDEVGQWSYRTEILIISIKSLIPLEEKMAIKIDEKRFLNELKLWQYYRHGSNKTLIDIAKNNNLNYWEVKDDMLPLRSLLLGIVNNNKKELINALVVHVLETTGDIEALFKNLVVGLMTYYWILNKGNLEMDRMSSLVKEDLMILNKSQYLLEFERHYKLKLDSYKGHFDIEFERQKIKFIGKIDGYLNGKDISDELEYLWWILKKGFVDKEVFFRKEQIVKDEKFIDNLFEYLLKLKKGRVDPKNLKINDYGNMDIFKFQENEIVENFLLKDSIVTKRGENKKYIKMLVKSKMGNLRFFKIKNI